MAAPYHVARGKPIPGLDYKRAGVDIDEGERLVKAIRPLAATTHRPGVVGEIGGFGALFDLRAAGFRDPLLVTSTDGVGTKLKIAIACDRHATVGIDLVAMCVNDLVVQGATPLFFLDYFATGQLRAEQGAAIVEGIAEGCRQARCALIGGETAEMPGLYAPGDYDLAGFAVGAVERDQVLTGSTVIAGDRLLGLAASGVHSNGFSLVRRVVESCGATWSQPAPFEPGRALGEALLTPTRIYVNACLAAHRAGGVRALAHITGGGLLENIPRVLPTGLAAEIDVTRWPLPAVYRWLSQEAELAPQELARTFNCGIGMVVIVNPDRAETLRALLRQEGETVFEIGAVVDAEPGRPRVRLLGVEAAWAS